MDVDVGMTSVPGQHRRLVIDQYVRQGERDEQVQPGDQDDQDKLLDVVIHASKSRARLSALRPPIIAGSFTFSNAVSSGSRK